MKPIVVCMLFVTAASAADRFHNIPTNLIYNFEQHRVDQPPQIENRDEDLNKYRNRPRTTPAPFPIDNIFHHGPESIHHKPEHHLPHLPQFPNHHMPSHHIPEHHKPGHHLPHHETTKFPYSGPQLMNLHLPATMPPPPSPKWFDAADSREHHQTHAPHRDQYLEVPKEYPTHNVQPRLTDSSSHYAASSAHPAHAHPYTGAQQSQSRGSHKFSWDDLLPAQQGPVTTPASAPTAAQNHPPPVPTLTPWSGDNFGK